MFKVLPGTCVYASACCHCALRRQQVMRRASASSRQQSPHYENKPATIARRYILYILYRRYVRAKIVETQVEGNVPPNYSCSQTLFSLSLSLLPLLFTPPAGRVDGGWRATPKDTFATALS